jgi:hypothetical protein
MGAVKFETVLALPANPEPGVVYYVKRADGELDTYVTSLAGVAVLQRSGHVQMHVEAVPPEPLAPAAEFGRYYATEALELIAALSGMRADVAATNESVLTVKLAGVTIATATFGPGETEAAIAILAPAVPARSLLVFMTPAVQDPTLAGVVGTFVARRT